MGKIVLDTVFEVFFQIIRRVTLKDDSIPVKAQDHSIEAVGFFIIFDTSCVTLVMQVSHFTVALCFSNRYLHFSIPLSQRCFPDGVDVASKIPILCQN